MASLHYLWTNRVRFSIGSKLFVRAWGKRFLSLPELFYRNQRRMKLVKRGANIHKIAEVGELKFEGNRKHLSIGELSFVGKVYMAAHAPISIGKRVCINDGVKILTASHDVMDPKWTHIKAEIVIEDYVWIGTGAMILPGVKLGHGVVVGAAAVVTKSFPARSIVAGNPAKLLSKQRATNLNYNPCEFLAANRAWLIG